MMKAAALYYLYDYTLLSAITGYSWNLRSYLFNGDVVSQIEGINLQLLKLPLQFATVNTLFKVRGYVRRVKGMTI